MSRMRCVVMLLAMVVFPMLASAAEAVSTAAEPVWYGNVQLWEIVAYVVVSVWGIVKVKYKLDERLDGKVTEFLEMGVQKTYDTFVREAKAMNPKGKLTAEQVIEARNKAFETARELAKAKGIDLARKVAIERAPVLITRIVNKLKKKK